MLKRLLIRYELLIFAGGIIAIWAFLNVLGITNTDSDLFWCIFGVGAAIEGIIELYYERQEDLKEALRVESELQAEIDFEMAKFPVTEELE